MLLVLDDDNCIVKYSLIGGLADDNVIEYDENKLPEDFDIKFQPFFYQLENDAIVENPDYIKPIPPKLDPSNLEKQISVLSYQQMVGSQAIDALQQQNAQMAYQIMTGGN